MSEDAKHNCHECGGRIAYPQHAFGTTIHCPHCGQQTTLGEIYPDAPVVPDTVKTKRLPDPLVVSATVALGDVPEKAKPSLTKALVIGGVSFAFVVGISMAVFLGLRASADKKALAELSAAQAAEAAAKATAEAAAKQVELGKQKAAAEEREKAEAVAKAVAEAKAQAIAKAAADAAAAAKLEVERKAKAEAQRKERLKSNAAAMAIWEEPDQEAIRILAARLTDATLKHKTTTVNLKHDDMPDWLRAKTQNLYREEGEAKALIREIEGKFYDLRTNPAGWVQIRSAEVIQVLGEGAYLMRNDDTSGSFSISVFKLKHNGLARILNINDRVQVNAFSAGTWTYNTKGGEVKTVPVYDPGLPVGPARDKIVPFR